MARSAAKAATQPAEHDAIDPTIGAPATRFPLSIRERRFVLAAGDFILGALACLIAFTLHPGHLREVPLLEPFLFGSSWVIALLIADGYAFQIPSSRFHSAIAIIKALPPALLFAVLSFFLHPFVLNRTIIVLALLIGAGMLILFRITVARLLLHESLAVRAVLLSDTEPKPEILSTLHAARFEYRVMATLVGSPADGDGEELLADVSKLLRRCGAHELVVTNNDLRLLPGLAEECLTQGVRVVSGSDLVERYMGRVPVDSVDVHWYLSLPDNDLLARPYALARRIADLLLSFLVSVPFVIILPFLALLIKLDSPGPVFYFQRRVGEHGREFKLLKLRTMAEDRDQEGPRYAEPKDPRVTRMGHFLRVTRLNEFPQLLNIVNGDMSFIGPRPELPEFEADLERQIPHFRSRLLVKPGLTGWAQVKGGYASTIPDITRKLEYDLYYIKNRSFRLDMQILANTFVVMLRRGGR